MTLRERRQSINMRQEDVAKRLDVDQSTVSKWERGVMPLSVFRKKLAKLYRCSVEDIENSVKGDSA